MKEVTFPAVYHEWPSSSSVCMQQDLHVKISVKGASPACEGEEGERYRDGHVHAHHANLNLVLVLARCWPRLGEDGCSIAVGVAVH